MFIKQDSDDKLWKISILDLKTNEKKTIICNYISIASGHHSIPQLATFEGQETFKGKNI